MFLRRFFLFALCGIGLFGLIDSSLAATCTYQDVSTSLSCTEGESRCASFTIPNRVGGARGVDVLDMYSDYCSRICQESVNRNARYVDCSFDPSDQVCFSGRNNQNIKVVTDPIVESIFRTRAIVTQEGSCADSLTPKITAGTSKTECQKIVTEQSHPNCIVGVAGGFLNGKQKEDCLLFEIQKCYDRCTDCSTAPTGPTRNKPANYDGPIPDCAFTYEGCRDINDVLQLIVNIGEFIFKIVGTVAFVFFIYGGVTMIASFGSADKFQKGKDILTAAVIGLVITFSAYLLIQFVLQTLGVSADLQSIK